MNTKNKVEAKIRTLVPELMELSVGCRFLHREEEYTAGGFDVGRSEWIAINKAGNRPIFEDINTGEMNIIGHPIHLESVLRAIGDRGVHPVCFNEHEFVIGIDGKKEVF